MLDVGLGQGLARRHAKIFVGTEDGAEHQTLFRFAGDDGRHAGLPAAEHACAGIEEESAHGLGKAGAVTRVAVGGEERADVGFEVGDAVGGGRNLSYQQGGQEINGSLEHFPSRYSQYIARVGTASLARQLRWLRRQMRDAVRLSAS